MNYSFWIAFQFFKYNLSATDEHGIHGPFLYDFYTKAINTQKDTNNFVIPSFWEEERAALLKDNTKILIQDLGAGSRVNKSNKRTFAEIAKNSLSTKKNLLRLLRMLSFAKAEIVIELGTNLGLTAIVLAKVFPKISFVSVEGDSTLFNHALTLKEKYCCPNLRLINDSFENALQTLNRENIQVDFMFLDGDHSSRGTKKYVNWFVENSAKNAFLLLDDIRWSKDMYASWVQSTNFAAFQLSLDLFDQGILIKNPNLKKQNFVLRR